MFEIYKPIIKKLVIGLGKIAVFFLVIHYSLPYLENMLGTRLDSIHTYFPWVIGASLAWVILRLLLNIITNYGFKDGIPQFSNGIAANIRYPLRDDADALIVKLSGLMDICDTRNNRADHARSYLNSREAYDVNQAPNKKGIIDNSAFDYLMLSYDIEKRSELIEFVGKLLQSLPEENRPEAKSTYGEALAILDKFSAVTETQLEKHHETTLPYVAFNLQRAAMLVRWGFTCNMINEDEWDLFKAEINDAYQAYFGDSGFGKFTYDYLIAVYLFHAKDNLDMVRERLYGLTELQKNNYLGLSWEAINALSSAK